MTLSRDNKTEEKKKKHTHKNKTRTFEWKVVPLFLCESIELSMCDRCIANILVNRIHQWNNSELKEKKRGNENSKILRILKEELKKKHAIAEIVLVCIVCKTRRKKKTRRATKKNSNGDGVLYLQLDNTIKFTVSAFDGFCACACVCRFYMCVVYSMCMICVALKFWSRGRNRIIHQE